MPVRLSVVAASILMAAIAGSSPVTAASDAVQCSARAEIMHGLAATYNEAPIAGGVANNGGVVELLNSKDGKTWTLVVSMPDGTSCLIAAGRSWNATGVAAGVSSDEYLHDPAPAIAPGRSL